jgi:hypothetical protein
MKRTISRGVALAMLAIVLSACAVPTTPNYDANFGEAVRQARAVQTLNPEASRNTDPVAGIDGQAAATAIDRYHDSFKAPPKTFDVFNIGGQLMGQ